MEQTKNNDVYLAIYDGKHDMSITVHSTKEGASTWLAREARYCLLRWHWHSAKYTSMLDKELVSNWSDITGDSESMRIERKQVRD